MKLKQVLALATLTLAAAGSAFADDRGTLTLTESSPGHIGGDISITPLADGSFDDYLTIDAGSMRSIGADLSSLKGVTFSDATVTDGAGHSHSFSGSGSNLHGDASDGPTRYFTLHLQGQVDTSGHNDGGYGVHVTAVPEPETYAMMLAGLGLMGAVVRRRKKTAN